MDLWNRIEPVRGFVREGVIFEHWSELGKQNCKRKNIFRFSLMILWLKENIYIYIQNDIVFCKINLIL